MIINFPNTPHVQGEMKLPRPAIYLLGTYHDPPWQIEAARKMEKSVGCIFDGRPRVSDQTGRLMFAQWQQFWMTECDILVFWLGPTVESNDGREFLWNEFEFGWACGSRKEFVIGVDPRLPSAKESIELTLGVLGLDNIVYSNQEELIKAVTIKR